MLDHFGLGEFFFIALFALLFFGPERLPQIGAQFGRWVGKMTQYSKAFMSEWREEALVVYDAVKEVKEIRDEIVAARAEIAGTLDTAREDIDGAISGARADVQQQVAQSTAAQAAPPPASKAEAPSGKDAQQVPDDPARKPPLPYPTPVGAADLDRLRDEVDELARDLCALQKELAQFRAGAIPPPPPPEEPAPVPGATEAVPA